MATVTRGTTYGSTETITNAKLHLLVDDATVTGIANADVSAGAAIAASKLDLTSSGYVTTGANNTFTGTNTFAALTGDIYTVPWTNYFASSTVVGWTSYTTSLLYYKKVGNLVFVTFNLAGTSNSTAITFTVPYTASTVVRFDGACGLCGDNGSWKTGACRYILEKNTAGVQIYSDMGVGSWTASGSKTIIGQFWYEAA